MEVVAQFRTWIVVSRLQIMEVVAQFRKNLIQIYVNLQILLTEACISMSKSHSKIWCSFPCLRGKVINAVKLSSLTRTFTFGGSSSVS